MRKIYTFLSLLFSLAAIAQNPVKGTVLDDQGLPLPGATVYVLETNEGVVTDFDGLFSIETESKITIQISFVGYVSQTLSANPGDDLSIVLQPSNQLDEVVITALGIEREEKALGYSVQGIKGSEVAKVKTPNVINALAGKISGVNITGSSAGPAASANITSR